MLLNIHEIIISSFQNFYKCNVMYKIIVEMLTLCEILMFSVKPSENFNFYKFQMFEVI